MNGSPAPTGTTAGAAACRKAGKDNRNRLIPIVCACLLAVGCSIGPDFEKPRAPIVDDWSSDNPVISRDSIALREWWKVFGDPVLDQLVEASFKHNLSLQLTGLRILEARARLGLAEASRYPQLQQISGNASANQISGNSANFNPALDRNFNSFKFGFDAAWEIDFRGRFRRSVEAADASA